MPKDKLSTNLTLDISNSNIQRLPLKNDVTNKVNPLLLQRKLKSSKTYEKIKEIQICMINVKSNFCRGVIPS